MNYIGKYIKSQKKDFEIDTESQTEMTNNLKEFLLYLEDKNIINTN